MTPTIAVVTGPTASGKTALSVALAHALHGEVVSADSMQVYHGMDIGTAKPTAREMDGVPHHMLDVAAPGEAYSVSRYEQAAAECVYDILARGKTPIVCGGTGLYIDALVRGGGFQPPGDAALRAALDARWAEEGADALTARLRAVDPESAARLHPGDKKRILRALEVHALTGKTITAHNAETRARPPRFEARTLALTTDPRSILYARIDKRVDTMLTRGLEDEVRRLHANRLLTGTAAQAIGYKELVDYIEGRCTLEEAADKIKQGSRNYAKRQLSWLRVREGVRWLVWNTPEQMDILLPEATDFLRASL